MDPLAPTSTVTADPSTTSATPAGQTPSQASQQAFQLALSYALNPPNVLGTADSDDDDDDGSSLTVGNSIAL